MKISLSGRLSFEVLCQDCHDKVKCIYSKACHPRTMFASIAGDLERTWYEHGTNLVRVWYELGLSVLSIKREVKKVYILFFGD